MTDLDPSLHDLTDAILVTEYTLIAATVAGDTDEGEVAEMDAIVLELVGTIGDDTTEHHTRFVIPQTDWPGLGTAGIKAILEYVTPDPTT